MRFKSGRINATMRGGLRMSCRRRPLSENLFTAADRFEMWLSVLWTTSHMIYCAEMKKKKVENF